MAAPIFRSWMPAIRARGAPRKGADESETAMKKIEATIRPSDLETVKERLADAGVRTVIASEALCLGESTHERRVYRGSTYIIDASPCTRLGVVVTDEQLEAVVDILSPAAIHGPIPDGAILVMNIEQVRTRTPSVTTGSTDTVRPLPRIPTNAPDRRTERQGSSIVHSIRPAVEGRRTLAAKPTSA